MWGSRHVEFEKKEEKSYKSTIVENMMNPCV